jgi:hypothetical protein
MAMDFLDEVKQLAERAQQKALQLQTEEATKVSLIMPFLKILGYDVFDPEEVVPEYVADVGTKKGEKVDYAIMRNGKPAILIEAKWVGDPLTGHDSQLFRYFTTTEAKYAILTNGLLYKFYTDLTETNKLDQEPFLVLDLQNPRDAVVAEVKKFHKASFDPESLYSAAENLKYSRLLRDVFDRELKEPSDGLVRLFMKDVYGGVLTEKRLVHFKSLVKRVIGQYLQETLEEKLRSAIQTTMNPSETHQEVAAAEAEALPEQPRVITTEDEKQGFQIIRAILGAEVEIGRITAKDTASYFNVLIDNNVRKWVCRFYFDGKRKGITVQGETQDQWIPIERLDDLFQHREAILASLRRVMGKKGT